MRDDPKSDPKNPTRREFLRNSGGTAAVAVIAGSAPVASSAAGQSSLGNGREEGPNLEGAVPITLRVNGKAGSSAWIRERRFSIASVRSCRSPELRRAVITANAAHARCT